MADYQTNYDINYNVNADQANEELDKLRAEVATLQAEVKKLQDASQANSSFVVSPQQAAAAVENLKAIQVGLSNVNIEYNNIDQSTGNANNDWKLQVVLWDELIQRVPHLVEYSKVIGEIGIAAYGVYNAFKLYPEVIATTQALVATASDFGSSVSTNFEKAALKITDLSGRFLGLRSAADLASFASQALIVEEFARASYNAAEAVKTTTLAIGNLSTEFTKLDDDSLALQRAKERYTELESASFRLGKSTDDLFDSYKALFDTLKNTSVSAKDGAQTFADIQAVQEKLRATTEETVRSNNELNAAYANGTTNVKQLASIFGASLYPALDSVAKQMGITKDKLIELISNGQVGSDVVLPALAAAARENTKELDTLTKSTEYTHKEIGKLIEQGKIAGGDVIPGLGTSLGNAGEQMSKTDKALGNLSNSWNKFLATVGAPLTSDTPQWMKDISDWFSNLSEESSNTWDQIKADAINGLNEVGIGLSVLANDAKEGFKVIVETATGAFWSITNWDFSQLGDSLDQMLQNAANNINDFTKKSNELIKSIQGNVDTTKQDTKAKEELKKAIDDLPLATLSDKFKETAKKINETVEASDAVNLVWKDLKNTDPFSGKDTSTLKLSLAIQEVSKKTGDASGTVDAFAKKLSELPADQLLKILDTAQKIPDQLKKIGDTGQIVQIITSAAFQKLNLDATQFGDSVSKSGQDTISSFAIIATSAGSTSAQIRAAFAKAIDGAKTQADLKELQTYFEGFAKSGKLSADEISLGMAQLYAKQVEIANQNNVVSESFKNLGVHSSRELETAANTAKTAFSVIEHGSSVVGNIEKSFWAWAEAETKAAEASGRAVDPLLRQHAAALGLSEELDKLIIKNTNTAASFATLAKDASSSAQTIMTAFDNAVNSATTVNQLDKIKLALDEAFAAGRISLDQLVSGINTLNLKSLELSQKVPGVEKAFKDLGVNSAASLRLLADKATQEYNTIKSSGTASAKDIEKSFLAAAEAEIKASIAAGKATPEFIKQQAAAQGLGLEVSELERKNQTLSSGFGRLDRDLQISTRNLDNEKSNIDSNAKSRVASIDVLKEEAAARGDTEAVTRYSIEQLEVEKKALLDKIAVDEKELEKLKETLEQKRQLAAQAGPSNQAAQEEVQTAEQSVNAKERDIQSTKDQVKEKDAAITKTKQHSESVQENSKAQEENIKHTNDGSAALQGLSAYLGQTRAEMDKLSAKTRQLFEVELQKALSDHGIEGSIGALRTAMAAFNSEASASEKRVSGFKAELAQANQLIDQSKDKLLFAANGFRVWEASIELAAGKAKKAFYEQSIQAEYLQQQVENLTNNGMRNLSVATNQLAAFSQQATNGFSLLDEQDLSNLKQALSDANQKLEEMKQKTQDAKAELEKLNEEILREKGLNDEADRLALENERAQNLAETESNLQKARLENNQELIRLYDEQKNKLEELYGLKEKNLETEIKAKANESKNNNDTTTTSSSNSGTSSSSSSSGLTHTLQFKSPSGQSVNVPTSIDQNTVNQIVSVLKQSGLTLA